MSIKRIELKNYNVFNNLQLDFSRGINIIVGENATGKTQLLKAVYEKCKVIKKEKCIFIMKMKH